MAQAQTQPQQQNGNVEAIVINFKESQNKKKALLGASLAVGLGAALSFVPVLGTALGAAVGGVIGSAIATPILNIVRNGRMPWSDLKAEDKQNLISGLANEAIWEKNLTNLEVVKNYIWNRCHPAGETPILSGSWTDFWNKNPWAIGRINAAIDNYNKQIDLAQRILKEAETQVNEFEQSKINLLAVNAILKIRKNQPTTETEKQAVKYYLALQEASNKAKSMKIGNQPKKSM